MQRRNYSIPFRIVIPKGRTIPNGTSQIEFDKVYNRKLHGVILALVSDMEIYAGYQANSIAFQNFGSNYKSIHPNVEQIPWLAYKPSFTNQDNIRRYFGVFEADGFDFDANLWEQEWFWMLRYYNI